MSFSAQFEDPGADTHTIVWGYGDEAQSNDSLTSVYVYTDFGTYSVTVTVTDDDGGESSDTLDVIITEPMIEDPQE